MNRITRKDLNDAVAIYVNALESHGMLTHPVQLQIGSQTNGIAYRAMFIANESGGLTAAPGTSNGYLGMTAREAYDTLWTITRTLQDVAYHRDQSPEARGLSEPRIPQISTQSARSGKIYRSNIR